MGPLVSDLPQLLETIALNQAVAFLPASTAVRYPRADLVYRPVTGLSPSIVAVAWQQGSRSPAIAAFVRAAVDVAERNAEAFTAAAPDSPAIPQSAGPAQPVQHLTFRT